MALSSVFTATVPALTRVETRSRPPSDGLATRVAAEPVVELDGNNLPTRSPRSDHQAGPPPRQPQARNGPSAAGPRMEPHRGHTNGALLAALITEMGGSVQPAGKGNYIDVKV